jgi:hypothetical protein
MKRPVKLDKVTVRMYSRTRCQARTTCMEVEKTRLMGIMVEYFPTDISLLPLSSLEYF